MQAGRQRPGKIGKQKAESGGDRETGGQRPGGIVKPGDRDREIMKPKGGVRDRSKTDVRYRKRSCALIYLVRDSPLIRHP